MFDHWCHRLIPGSQNLNSDFPWLIITNFSPSSSDGEKKNNRTKLKVETLLTDRCTLSCSSCTESDASNESETFMPFWHAAFEYRARTRIARDTFPDYRLSRGSFVTLLLIRERDSVRSCREPGIKCASMVGRGSVWPCP